MPHVGRLRRRPYSWFGRRIHIFLEFPNTKYGKILCLIDYIDYGSPLSYKLKIFKEVCRKPISQHSGLDPGLYKLKMFTGALRRPRNSRPPASLIHVGFDRGRSENKKPKSSPTESRCGQPDNNMLRWVLIRFNC